jgi:hypothetical protein
MSQDNLRAKYLAITPRNNLVTIRGEFTAPDTKLAEGG